MACAEGLAIALLAAGRSTRFGVADKLTAPLAGKPLAQWAAEAGCAVEADWRFFVTAPDSPLDFAGLGYTRLANAERDRGLSSSLGVAAAAAEQVGAEALLILLADMPLVSSDHLAAVILRGRGAVFSRTPDGIPQPPALFPRSLFAALQTLEGDKGARSLAGDATLIDISADQFIDIDTPDDLARAERMLASSPGQR